MLYCFLNSDNKERKYSTLFEALTKCYTPLGESPLCLCVTSTIALPCHGYGVMDYGRRQDNLGFITFLHLQAFLLNAFSEF